MTLDTLSEMFGYIRKAADASGAAVLLVYDAHIIHANLEASTLTGWAVDALNGRPVDELIDLPECGTRNMPRDLHRADGSTYAVVCSVAVVDGDLLMVTLLDTLQGIPRTPIDDNKVATRALSSSTVNYARMLANLTESACIIDAHSVVMSTNEHFARLSGFSHTEIVGRSVASVIHPEDRSRAENTFAATDATGETQQLLYRIVGRSGEIIPIESSIHKLERGSLLLLSHRADQPTQISAEYIRQNLALEQNLNAMRRALLRMIAHEMRTPLAAIMTSSEIMGRYHDKITDDKRNLYMNRVRAQVEYLQELMHDVTFALGGNQQEEEATYFAIDETCRRVFKNVQRIFEQHFTLEIQGETFEYHGVERYIARSVCNLLALAIKHAEPSIEVKLALCEHGHEYGLIMSCGLQVTAESMSNAILLTHPDIVQPNKPLFGLGMVILRDYAHRLGGRITVHDIHHCDAIAFFWPKVARGG